jgi:hypothetical protein
LPARRRRSDVSAESRDAVVTGWRSGAIPAGAPGHLTTSRRPLPGPRHGATTSAPMRRPTAMNSDLIVRPPG